ncbi:zinc ribbon domain-containing protein [Patescibacteria group bacterium]|nr:zinc ribbon domain-containing protein [Patescibacteria group bacterium]MBU1683826.1 zinc ribbon domain-containing protein [Patescibacteria group bacterium]MBU1935087.1 zinc ribbon domain-containing protein [Patescibacteria group bacterium]
MPNYKFKCLECGHCFEKLLPPGHEDQKCLECGHPKTEKLLEAPGVQYKSEGFTKKSESGGGCSDDKCKDCPHNKK